MKAFITGGGSSGKSYYAQRMAMALEVEPLYYVATMWPMDDEDRARVARHRTERRDWGFETVEQPSDIEGILDKCDPGGAFLLDSVTALLSNEMFLADGSVNEQAAEKIIGGLAQVIPALGHIVIVSDYIYSDAVLYDPLTEAFRRSLAAIDRAVAAMCDAVIEVAYGNTIWHKGRKAPSA